MLLELYLRKIMRTKNKSVLTITGMKFTMLATAYHYAEEIYQATSNQEMTNVQNFSRHRRHQEF